MSNSLFAVIGFLFKSVVLAAMACSIVMPVFALADRVTRLAGLPELHGLIANSGPAFLGIAAIAWLFAEINLVRTSLRTRPHSGSTFEGSLPVFYPLIVLLYVSFAFIVIGGAGLVAATIVHLLFSETVSYVLGAAVIVAFVCWVAYVVWA